MASQKRKFNSTASATASATAKDINHPISTAANNQEKEPNPSARAYHEFVKKNPNHYGENDWVVWCQGKQFRHVKAQHNMTFSDATQGVPSNMEMFVIKYSKKTPNVTAASSATKPLLVPAPVVPAQKPLVSAQKLGVPAQKPGVAAQKLGVPAQKLGVPARPVSPLFPESNQTKPTCPPNPQVKPIVEPSRKVDQAPYPMQQINSKIESDSLYEGMKTEYLALPDNASRKAYMTAVMRFSGKSATLAEKLQEAHNRRQARLELLQSYNKKVATIEENYTVQFEKNPFERRVIENLLFDNFMNYFNNQDVTKKLGLTDDILDSFEKAHNEYITSAFGKNMQLQSDSDSDSGRNMSSPSSESLSEPEMETEENESPLKKLKKYSSGSDTDDS